VRKLLLLLLLLFCARPVRAAYAFDQTVTIDHTKVGASDSTNFPFAFFGIYGYLATTGNGGNVQSSSGYDIAFGINAGCTSLLSWEQESWTAASGSVAYWVLLPTLSHTSDTVIHLCYGDAGVSSFQGGASGAVWDSNFKAVWHLPNGVTTSGADSTSNAVNTSVVGSSTAGTGEIDGGIVLAAAGKWITANNPYSSATFSGNGLTLEAWVNPSPVPATIQQVVSMEGAYVLSLLTAGLSADLKFEIDGSGTDITSTGSYSNGVWNHFVTTSDSSGNLKMYINGVLDATTGTQSFYNLDSLTRGYVIGGHPTTGANNVSGSIDEARISNSVRSADWILAEYNNQGLPCTFYTPNGSGCAAPSTQTQIGGFLVGP
jgi:hypothetical protein